MKTQLATGPDIALAMMALAGLSVSFLPARQQVIRLAPMSPSPNAGYVWKRVFLGRKARKGC